MNVFTLTWDAPRSNIPEFVPDYDEAKRIVLLTLGRCLQCRLVCDVSFYEACKCEGCLWPMPVQVGDEMTSGQRRVLVVEVEESWIRARNEDGSYFTRSKRGFLKHFRPIH